MYSMSIFPTKKNMEIKTLVHPPTLHFFTSYYLLENIFSFIIFPGYCPTFLY